MPTDKISFADVSPLPSVLSPVGERHPLHIVQFYNQDQALLDSLSKFIGTTLEGGGAAIVLATRPHRQGLLARLNGCGLEPSKVIREGRLILLDAGDTLGQIMVGDLPDPVPFTKLMGELIVRARNAAEDEDADLAIFGELVALLWADGKADAAIQLEQFSNGLAHHHQFSLRCGYPISGFFRAEHSAPFLKICAEHSLVIPSEPYPDLDTEQKRSRTVAHLQQRAQVLDYQLALRHSEEPFRLFVEAVRDYAIFMLDPQGRVITWNSGAKRIKGYEAAEIIGQHFSRFYPEEDIRAEKPQRELQIAAREGRLEDEGWRVRKDGSLFWANVIITALRNQAGNLLGFGKVTRDFTERMQVQEALRAEVGERVAAQAKLQESEKSLRRLSLHLLRTQDEERRRIGRELHDSLGQYLSVLKMKIDSLNRSTVSTDIAEIRQDIAECAKLAEESIKEVRTISYLLYPPMLEEMGLKSAVPWYLDGFTRRSGIKTTLEITPRFPRLSRDVELAIFRVLQESLTNVHRHSGSPSATVRLLLRDQAAALQVIDKGKGMPAAGLEETGQDWMGALGVGLRGMVERIRQLGGGLELSSTSAGTTVTATVPIEAARTAGSPECSLEPESGETG